MPRCDSYLNAMGDLQSISDVCVVLLTWKYSFDCDKIDVIHQTKILLQSLHKHTQCPMRYLDTILLVSISFFVILLLGFSWNIHTDILQSCIAATGVNKFRQHCFLWQWGRQNERCQSTIKHSMNPGMYWTSYIYASLCYLTIWHRYLWWIH